MQNCIISVLRVHPKVCWNLDVTITFERKVDIIYFSNSKRLRFKAASVSCKCNFQIDWAAYFNAVFNDTDVEIDETEQIIVAEPIFFQKLTQLLNVTSDRVKADYIYWQTVKLLAAEGPELLRSKSSNFDLNFYRFATARETHCFDKTMDESTGFKYAVVHKYISQKY